MAPLSVGTPPGDRSKTAFLITHTSSRPKVQSKYWWNFTANVYEIVFIYGSTLIQRSFQDLTWMLIVCSYTGNWLTAARSWETRKTKDQVSSLTRHLNSCTQHTKFHHAFDFVSNLVPLKRIYRKTILYLLFIICSCWCYPLLDGASAGT